MRVVNLKLWTVCNYQVAIPWINTSGNTETLGCKFNTDLWWWENKGSLWGASRSYRPQPRFALTWFYFSQELSPSARKRLPWQDPQRLDSPFIWLWFTRPSDGGFWWGGWSLPLCCGLTPFYYKQQTHRSTVSTGDSTLPEKCAAVTWQMIACWSTWCLRHACQRNSNIRDHLK